MANRSEECLQFFLRDFLGMPKTLMCNLEERGLRICQHLRSRKLKFLLESFLSVEKEIFLLLKVCSFLTQTSEFRSDSRILATQNPNRVAMRSPC